MLSKTPSSTLRIMRVAKLVAVPWQARTIDQQSTADVRYFPIGNFTNPTDPGILAAR